MRIGWTIGLIFGIATVARAADVTAHLATDGKREYVAQGLAQSILQRAGVSLRWVKAGSESIRIELAFDTPEDYLPGALAVAYPFSGCRKAIRVFGDRIQRLTGGRADAEPVFLGYVLAHEITHVLQGVDRHSDAGVMKASWSMEDRSAIISRRMELHEEDIWLIQAALPRGACGSLDRITARAGVESAVRPGTR